MTGKKTKIDSPNEKISVGDIAKKNFHANRDAIITAIECSKRSKVPFLFLSNPGYGKTTDVYMYGKKFGYHVEVLSGDQFARDEILGYQVNEPSSPHLLSKEPEWYSRIIMAKEGTLPIPHDPLGRLYPKGTPSILFLDEISVAPSDVQGAMLQLSKDRCIHGGKFLPEDCIVLSAANYKGNLPGYCNIISPQLNRFCIVNLLPGKFDSDIVSSRENIEMLSEFLYVVDDSEIMNDDFPVFTEDYEMSMERKHEILNVARAQICEIVRKYENIADSSKGYLDLRNVNFDGIYDRDDENPEVFNILTGRSVHNLVKVIIALCEMGVDKDNPIYKKFIDGLVGLGTNNWAEETAQFRKQVGRYLEEWYSMVAMLLSKYNAKNVLNTVPKKTVNRLNKLNDTSSISGMIRQLIQNRDSIGGGIYSSPEYQSLVEMIEERFSDSNMEALVSSLSEQKNITLFRSDYENLRLIMDAMEKDSASPKGDLKRFKEFYASYDFYYNSIYTGITSEQVA